MSDNHIGIYLFSFVYVGLLIIASPNSNGHKSEQIPGDGRGQRDSATVHTISKS